MKVFILQRLADHLRITFFTSCLEKAMAKLTTLEEHEIKSNLFLQIISGYANLKYLFTCRAGPNSETDA